MALYVVVHSSMRSALNAKTLGLNCLEANCYNQK